MNFSKRYILVTGNILTILTALSTELFFYTLHAQLTETLPSSEPDIITLQFQILHWELVRQV
ncbi:hypothetical protein BH23THE1_BH23THE1_33720 [soil metagenome]